MILMISLPDYQDQAQEISQDPDQDLEQDQVEPPEEEGELAFEDEDTVLHQGNPNVSQLILT